MAWTATDLATVETAIANGTLSVQFGDRSVTYRSISELMKARDAIKQSINATAGITTRCTYATFGKG
jgi:hypothetical protein